MILWVKRMYYFAWTAFILRVNICLGFADVNFDEYDKSDDPHDYKFVRWLTKEKVGKENLKVLCHGPFYACYTGCGPPKVYFWQLHVCTNMVNFFCLCNWQLNSTVLDLIFNLWFFYINILFLGNCCYSSISILFSST